MKQIANLLFVAICLTTIVSCGGKHSKRVLQLEAQLDSVSALSEQQKVVIDDMTSFCNEFSILMDSLRIQESILTLTKDENGRPLKKSVIRKNLELLQEILVSKRSRIAELDSLLNLRNDQVKQLSSLVITLYDEIDLKENKIKELQKELEESQYELSVKRREISQLNEDVQGLTSEISEQRNKNDIIERENEALKETIEEGNWAYYLIANRKTLQEYGLVSGLSNKLNMSDVDLSVFTRVNKKNFSELEITGRFPKVLSVMPEESYDLFADSIKRYAKLSVKDKSTFWKYSQILVIIVQQ